MILRAFALAFLTVPVAMSIPISAQAPGDQHAVHQLHGDPKAYIAALELPLGLVVPQYLGGFEAERA